MSGSVSAKRCIERLRRCDDAHSSGSFVTTVPERWQAGWPEIVRGADDIHSHHQMVAKRLGVDASFSTSLDYGGASQILSVILAVMVIEASLATTVVCGYGRDSRRAVCHSACNFDPLSRGIGVQF